MMHALQYMICTLQSATLQYITYKDTNNVIGAKLEGSTPITTWTFMDKPGEAASWTRPRRKGYKHVKTLDLYNRENWGFNWLYPA